MAIRIARRRMAGPRFGRAPSYSIARTAAGGSERDKRAVIVYGERRRVVKLQRMAEDLLDRIEGVDQCQVLDKFAVGEAEEMRDPVADDAPVGRARGNPVQGRGAVAVREHLVADEGEDAEDRGNAMVDQIEDSLPAAVAAAEGQHIDRPADR